LSSPSNVPPSTLLGIALLTAILRAPFLGAPMTPDEGGFLLVAQQWRSGSSLYGDYWVDRPPLLLELFGLADGQGGLLALRLLGCLAAVLTVLFVGLAARRVAGPIAATWSAAVACALLVSPLAGTLGVNGELLAAPLIAGGAWLATVAVAGHGGRIPWAAVGAGCCAAAAVLVKQNMLDVLVFAGALGLASRRYEETRAVAGPRRLALWFAAGCAVTLGGVAGLAMSRGSSPAGIWFAMYPFRWRAALTVDHITLGERLLRLAELAGIALLTGGPLVVIALVVVARRPGLFLRLRESLPLSPFGRSLTAATLALAAYAVVSVVAGGSYWLHYQVQLVVPAALAAGLLVLVAPRVSRRLVALVLISSAIAWTVGLVHRTPAEGQETGEAIGRVAEAGDTAISAFGDPSILRVAGLRSPYPYLWSLPARTLDPRFHTLEAVLSGPDAPTWLVVRGPTTQETLDRSAPGVPMRERYHRVARVCGRTIYLRNGLQRLPPVADDDCREPVSRWFTHWTGGAGQVVSRITDHRIAAHPRG
jgi:hypothetical protein